jgi:hypothetical protein
MIGTLGALTTTIRIRTNVLVLPLRHPVAVAKAVGTAAVATGGRVELGVGGGHLKDEFDVLGADFGTRGRPTDEAIRALRSLLQPRPVSYAGQFWDIPPIYLHADPAAAGALLVHDVLRVGPAAHRPRSELPDIGDAVDPAPLHGAHPVGDPPLALAPLDAVDVAQTDHHVLRLVGLVR